MGEAMLPRLRCVGAGVVLLEAMGEPATSALGWVDEVGGEVSTMGRSGRRGAAGRSVLAMIVELAEWTDGLHSGGQYAAGHYRSQKSERWRLKEEY